MVPKIKIKVAWKYSRYMRQQKEAVVTQAPWFSFMSNEIRFPRDQ